MPWYKWPHWKGYRLLFWWFSFVLCPFDSLFFASCISLGGFPLAFCFWGATGSVQKSPQTLIHSSLEHLVVMVQLVAWVLNIHSPENALRMESALSAAATSFHKCCLRWLPLLASWALLPVSSYDKKTFLEPPRLGSVDFNSTSNAARFSQKKYRSFFQATGVLRFLPTIVTPICEDVNGALDVFRKMLFTMLVTCWKLQVVFKLLFLSTL